MFAPTVGEQVDIVAVALREIDGRVFAYSSDARPRQLGCSCACVHFCAHVQCAWRCAALCSPGAQQQGGYWAAPQEIRCRSEGGAEGSRLLAIVRH